MRSESLLSRANPFNKSSIAPALAVVYGLMVLIFTLINPRFFSLENAKAIMAAVAVSGIVAVGLTPVVLTKNFDMSIGSNPRAAQLSGIRVKPIKVLLYLAMGVVTGLASILMIALSGVGYIYHGDNLTLPVLSAVFLGGMSLEGGEGSIWKTVIGVTIITIIFTGLSLLNVQFYFITISQGLALVIIVAFYEIRKNRQAARQA